MRETWYICKDEECRCHFAVQTIRAAWDPGSLSCPLCKGEVKRAEEG